MNWTNKEARMGPIIDPMPKAPVLIDATLDCSFYLRFSGSSCLETLVYSSSSVWNIAGTLLLLTKAAPIPLKPQPIQRIHNLLHKSKVGQTSSTYTYSGRKGAGPVRIMEKTKKQSPPNIIRPYFIPLRSSLTPFRHMEVKAYVTVSIEKIPPIY